MDHGEDFRKLGTANVGELVEAISALPPQVWDADRFRQDVFPEHRMTKTLPLLFDQDFRHVRPTRHPTLDQLDGKITPVLAAVSDAYERGRHRCTDGTSLAPGYFIRALLTWLEPGGEIPRHHDGGPSLTRSHRVHIPLKTSSAVTFEVGESRRCLRRGELWEINNMRAHRVVNGGDDERIHLIVDYVIPGEITMARSGRPVVC